MRRVLAPCKINLGLHVLRQRPDGFRDIDTVFVRVPWCDEITYREGDADAAGIGGGAGASASGSAGAAVGAEAVDAAAVRGTMSNSDPALPVDESNLCLGAAMRLAAAARGAAAAGAPSSTALDGAPPQSTIPGTFHLHLDKRVPYGAGLGSGSSDAAAVLMMLADEWSVASSVDLHAIAADLGSDIPFFLGAPVARGTGRGEILTPIDWTCPFHLVVAVPDVHVPTGPAYGLVNPRGDSRPDLEAAIRSNDPDRWRADLVNDFQEPVIAAFPAVGRALDALNATGARYAAMSGSGSSVFGVFESELDAMMAADELAADGCRTWSGLAEG